MSVMNTSRSDDHDRSWRTDVLRSHRTNFYAPVICLPAPLDGIIRLPSGSKLLIPKARPDLFLDAEAIHWLTLFVS